MPSSTTTKIDLARLALSPGEGTRLELPVRIEPLELGGQAYRAEPATPEVRLEISRPTRGYAFRLRFRLRMEGPCMRCLAASETEAAVDVREVDQEDTEDEELRSPYVEGDILDLERWARDAAALSLPSRILCRPDCAGLCSVCGEPLNDADPEAHRHGETADPRWAKLRDLKLE